MATKPSKKATKKISSKGPSKRKGTATSKEDVLSKKKLSKSITKTKKKRTRKKQIRKKQPNKPPIPRHTVKALIPMIVEEQKALTVGAKYRKEFDEIARINCEQGLKLKRLAKLFGVSYGTVLYWKAEHPSFYTSVTRGYRDWLLALPDKLVAHMAKGFSYTAFAGEISRSRDFLFALEKSWPEWLEAKNEGLPKGQAVLEQMAYQQIMGKSVVSLGETPVLYKGELVKDSAGNTVMIEKKTLARPDAKTLNLIMTNRFEDYKQQPKDSGSDEILDELREAIAILDGEATDGQELDDDTPEIE